MYFLLYYMILFDEAMSGYPLSFLFSIVTQPSNRSISETTWYFDDEMRDYIVQFLKTKYIQINESLFWKESKEDKKQKIAKKSVFDRLIWVLKSPHPTTEHKIYTNILELGLSMKAQRFLSNVINTMITYLRAKVLEYYEIENKRSTITFPWSNNTQISPQEANKRKDLAYTAICMAMQKNPDRALHYLALFHIFIKHMEEKNAQCLRRQEEEQKEEQCRALKEQKEELNGASMQMLVEQERELRSLMVEEKQTHMQMLVAQEKTHEQALLYQQRQIDDLMYLAKQNTELRQRQEKHALELLQREEKHALELLQREEKHAQELLQREKKHSQELLQREKKHAQELRRQDGNWRQALNSVLVATSPPSPQ